MKSSDASTEIRVAVLGEWVPPQLGDVLARQRAEEPETTAALADWKSRESEPSLWEERVDFALSTTVRQWPGWQCEPLWHDRLAVAVARRSPLLAYAKVPCEEALKQQLICVRSTVNEPWRKVVQDLFGAGLGELEQTVGTFELAMTLVSAGYGIAVAPAARVAGHLHRGIAVRPLVGAPDIVMTYLLHPCTALTESQIRFVRRARAVT